jgi:hypothetical protein
MNSYMEQHKELVRMDDLLKEILANDCPKRISKDKYTQLHRIELHCNSVWVIVNAGNVLGYAFENHLSRDTMNAWVDLFHIDWEMY